MDWVGLYQRNFLNSIEIIDYLKLKATAGVLAYDGQTAYNLYRDRWNNNGTVRINNSLQPMRTNFSQMGNPDLKWEKSREVNIGMETLLFNNKLWIEANYFNELRYDIISKANSLYPASFGGFYPTRNFGKVANRGFELEVKYANKAGELNYQAGINLMYSKNKVLVTDESNGVYTNLNLTGKPSMPCLDRCHGIVWERCGNKLTSLSYLGAYQVGILHMLIFISML